MQFGVTNPTQPKESFRSRSERALKLFREEYSEQHQTKLNRWLHVAGRGIRVAAIPALFFDWRIALGLFVFGYLIQFLGHAIEGTSPSFFRNPKHLIIGSLNHVARAIDKLKGGVEKPLWFAEKEESEKHAKIRKSAR